MSLPQDCSQQLMKLSVQQLLQAPSLLLPLPCMLIPLVTTVLQQLHRLYKACTSPRTFPKLLLRATTMSLNLTVRI